MSKMWGEYRPILWNCHHFAALLAQLVVDTDVSASVIGKVLGAHHSEVHTIRVKRHLICMGAFTLFGLTGFGLGVFAAWSVAGRYMLTDEEKESRIWEKVKELVKEYPELEKLFGRRTQK
jgi:hypothetical protein